MCSLPSLQRRRTAGVRRSLRPSAECGFAGIGYGGVPTFVIVVAFIRAASLRSRSTGWPGNATARSRCVFLRVGPASDASIATAPSSSDEAALSQRYADAAATIPNDRFDLDARAAELPPGLDAAFALTRDEIRAKSYSGVLLRASGAFGPAPAASGAPPTGPYLVAE